MSIFFICSIACIALFAFTGSLSPSSLPRIVGIICHDRPYLSCSQPHWSSRPPADSFFHSSSTSCCVSQFTNKEIACVNLKWGPPFSAELLTLERKRTPHHRALGPGPRVAVARHASDLRVLEDRHVEVHRLFGVVVEPQERHDLLHVTSVGTSSGRRGGRSSAPRRSSSRT